MPGAWSNSMLSSSKAYIPMLDAGGVKVNPCFLCVQGTMIADSHDSDVIIGSSAIVLTRYILC